MRPWVLWLVGAGSTRRHGGSPAGSILMDAGSDRRESARVSHGVIPQAKIKTIKMTFAIVLGMHLSAFSHRAHAPPSLSSLSPSA